MSGWTPAPHASLGVVTLTARCRSLAWWIGLVSDSTDKPGFHGCAVALVVVDTPPKKKRKENGFLAILRLCPPTRMVKLLSDLLERLSYISDLQRLGIKFGHELNDLVMMFEITSPQVLSIFALMGSNFILPKWWQGWPSTIVTNGV